jgi:hypothetical protein
MAEFDHRTVVELGTPAALAAQLQLFQRGIRLVEQGRQHLVGLQHQRCLALRAVQHRQDFRLDLALVGFEHLAKVVDQARVAFGAPEGHRLVFLQHHLEAVREFALHQRPPHPGHGLEHRARGGQVHREKIAGQPGRHVGAQRDRVVMHQLALHADRAQAEQGLAQHPGDAQRHDHGGKRQAQDHREGVHELDVQRHDGGHGRSAFQITPPPVSGGPAWRS